jgi:hypothetical protein
MTARFAGFPTYRDANTLMRYAELTEAPRWKTPTVLYHCTLAQNVPAILEQGLDPKRSRTQAYQSIFLAGDLWKAEDYAHSQHSGKAGPYTILAIKLAALDKSLLEPDGDDLPDMLWDMGIHDSGAWKNYTWRQSLRIAGQCSYAGVIPPSAITVIKEIMTEATQVLPRFEDVVTPAMRAALDHEFDRSVHGPEGYMTSDSREQWIRDRMPKGSDAEIDAAFEDWLRARYQEVRRKLARLAARPTIKAWRVLRVARGWLQHPRTDLGIYWTYNLRRWNEEIGAYPVWADEASNTIDLLITAEVPNATVDWLRTFRAHMDYYSGDREYELRLKPGSPVGVSKVQDLATRRPLAVQGRFTA